MAFQGIDFGAGFFDIDTTPNTTSSRSEPHGDRFQLRPGIAWLCSRFSSPPRLHPVSPVPQVLAPQTAVIIQLSLQLPPLHTQPNPMHFRTMTMGTNPLEITARHAYCVCSKQARLARGLGAIVVGKCNATDNVWVKTSIPERTPLASSGQFSGLESHQSGNKCTYSPRFIRAMTAPPNPQAAVQARDQHSMDVDDDDSGFTFGRSSSCPPLDEPARRSPSPPPPISFVPTSETRLACPGIPLEWDIETGKPGRSNSKQFLIAAVLLLALYTGIIPGSYYGAL
ncbi:hypothetical protein B0H13DRAFT_2315391 [Mycena leptocephala]|nr:hypothetical protein B0H13DRAFT_2315391 [Mycena leptocephala]